MSSERFDNIFRNALDEQNLIHDVGDWAKMEAMLDTHLPQEKKRRRFILWLSLFPIAIVAIYFLTRQADSSNIAANNSSSKINAENKTTVVSKTETSTRIEKEQTPAAQISTAQNENVLPIDKRKASTIATNPDRKENKQIPLTAAVSKNNQRSPFKLSDKKTLTPSNKKSSSILNVNNSLIENSSQHSIGTVQQNQYNNKTFNSSSSADSTLKNTSTSNKSTIDTTDIIKPISDSLQGIAASEKNKKQKTAKKPRKWLISFLAGLNASKVGNGDYGKFKSPLGISVGYELSKKLTVKMGILVGRKIYSAQSNQYKVPNQFWSSALTLEQINANCNLYEIPLTLSYNFLQRKKHSWFATVGTSSYIMKSETYYCSLKDGRGELHYYKYNYRKNSVHLFSGINLSGGYLHHLNKKVFVTAEPYVQLPVSGVGFGNIKLKSAGILFSLGIKPF